MAITVEGITSAAAATAGASWSSAVTTSWQTGQWMLVFLVTDNITGSDGDNAEHTGFSAGGETWIKIAEHTNGGSGPDTGVTISAWIAKRTGATISTINFTAAFSASIEDKCISVVRIAAGDDFALVPGTLQAVLTDGASNFGSASISGLPAAERIYLHLLGKKAGTTVAITPTSGFTALSGQRSRSGTSAVTIRGEQRIATSTGETSAPVMAVVGDTAQLFFAMAESGVTPIAWSGTVSNQTAVVGAAFSLDLSAGWTGSAGPFAFDLAAGELPPGLGLDPSTSEITGSPTTPGVYPGIVVRGTDAASNTATTNAFTISVTPGETGYFTLSITGTGRHEHTTVSHSFHHAGRWWTCLPTGATWGLFEESGSVPSTPGSTVDWVSVPHVANVHTSTQCTVAVDSARNRAFVLGFGVAASTVQMRVLDYAEGAWTVTQSFNVAGTAGVGVGASSPFSNNRFLSLGIDPNGVPFVFAGSKGGGAGLANGCHIAWPDSPAALDGIWSFATIDASSITAADASGRFAGVMSQGGTDYIVVAYTDDANLRVKLAYHAVETTMANYAAGWVVETVDTPPSTDNHVWAGVIKHGGEQVVVTAVKEGDGTPAGRIYCHTSRLLTGMAWEHKKHRVANGPSAETPSRPVGVLDETNGSVVVVYHSNDSYPYGWVGGKSALLADLLAATSETDVFDVSHARNAPALIYDLDLASCSDASTPAHPVTADMGYWPVTALVTASSTTGSGTWWGSEEILSAGVVPAGTLTLGTPSVTASSISLPWTYSAADHDGIEYRYRLTAGTWSAWTDAGLVSPIEITGLTSGAEYEIEARAYNPAGTSTPQTVTVTVGAQIDLSGAALSTATAAGTLTTSVQLAGAAASLSAASGDITAQITLSGAALAQAAATAALTAGAADLAGDAVALATALGTLTVQIRLAGDAVAQSLASADLSTESAGLSGAAQASATAMGLLGTAIPLAGQATATAAASGSLGVPILLSGAAAAVSSATGELTLALSLEGHSLATALASGSITTAIPLSGAAIAQALASGALAGTALITPTARTWRVRYPVRLLRVRT